MVKGYNFPFLNGGIIGGINDSGIETFNGTPIYSMTKESIQNALDAKSENLQGPVRVEFKLSYIERELIPYIQQFTEILLSCKAYWEHSEKTTKIIDKAIDLINNSKIPVLEISDYNTTGLKGATEEKDSPFNNLVKSSGVSNKDDDAGGSFGIGKNAPYTCSILRSIIYSTLDEENILALQGVSKLVTHKKLNRDTQGTGFLGISENDENRDEKNRPFLNDEVSENINPRFIRKSVGTSVFVMGFIEEENWQVEIIKATIDHYFMAIIENNLEVVVGETVINKDTLNKVIETYLNDEESSLTLHYYNTVIGKNEDCEVIENEDFEGLGKIKLFLFFGDNLPKKVAYIRSNGMKIINKDKFRVTQQFVGVLKFEGTEINKFIRSLENPSHDKIEYKRHENSSYAKKVLNNLGVWIRDCIREFENTNTKEILDAEGIGKYLPSELDEGTNKSKIEEVIGKVILNTKVEEIQKPGKSKPNKAEDSDDSKEPTNPYPTGKTRSGRGKHKKNPNNEEEKIIPIDISRSRIFSPSMPGHYRVIIKSKNKCNSYLQFRIVGEENSEIANIIYANELNGKKIPLKNGAIGPIKFQKDEVKVLEIKLSRSIRCAMEVVGDVNNI